MDFYFKPDKTGLYRFFTMPYQGKEQGSGNELKLYQEEQRLASNMDSGGPYGAHYAKIEYNLQAGKTYVLKLSNPSAFKNPSSISSTILAYTNSDPPTPRTR